MGDDAHPAAVLTVRQPVHHIKATSKSDIPYRKRLGTQRSLEDLGWSCIHKGLQRGLFVREAGKMGGALTECVQRQSIGAGL